MNAYAAKDAKEERRLENAAWQDAESQELAQKAFEAMEAIGSELTSRWSDDEYDTAQDALYQFLKGFTDEMRVI